METVRVSGPVVDITIMELARYVDAKGIGEPELFRFSHEILWVRRVIPTVSFWHGVHKIRDAGSYCDVGGFMTSIPAAVEAAESCCKSFDVNMNSTMRVLITATVEDVAVLRQKNGEKRDVWFGFYEYPSIPSGWLIEKSGASLSTPLPVFESIIWTSISPAACNTLCVEKFKERWNVPSLIEQR